MGAHSIKGVIGAGLAGIGLLLLAPTALAADADLDPSFGTDGFAPVPGPLIEVAESGPQEDKVVVAGARVLANGSTDVVVSRLNADGSVDGTFGDGGETTLGLGLHDSESPAGLQIDTEGRIVVTGATSAPGVEARYFVFRLTADGHIDAAVGGSPGTGFSGDGIAIGRFGVCSTERVADLTTIPKAHRKPG
jgi:uncharacterized delta-60 repeat protein